MKESPQKSPAIIINFINYGNYTNYGEKVTFILRQFKLQVESEKGGIHYSKLRVITLHKTEFHYEL